jgi:hypothetical protein
MEAGYLHAIEREDGKWDLSSFFREPIETFNSAQEVLDEMLKQNVSIKFTTYAALQQETEYLEQYA